MAEIRLWLDDKRPMPQGFTHHVMTAQEAIALLGPDLVEIGFDHDLGDRTVVGDGYEVAKEIERMAYEGKLPRIRWSIQSDNGPGRENIRRAMTSAERFWDEWEVPQHFDPKYPPRDIASEMEDFAGYLRSKGVMP